MADNNTILEKLEGLVARFEEVSTLITDPAVIADQKRYVKLTKEYKELGDLMNARKEYMQVLGGIEEAKEIIANETDHACGGRYDPHNRIIPIYGQPHDDCTCDKQPSDLQLLPALYLIFYKFLNCHLFIPPF